MKRLISKIGYTLLLTAVIFGLKAQNSMSLDEAINYALTNNENLKNAIIATQDADAQVGFTRADGLPQINANFGYTNNTQIPVSLVPANVFDPTASPDDIAAVEFGIQHQSQFGLSATQMIWDGSFFIGLKAAKTLREKVIVDEEKARLDVIEQVTKAYYLVLVNQVRTELIDTNISTVESTLSDTRALYENGFVEKIDVTRLQVQLNNLKAEKNGVETAINTSMDILKFSMGMPVQESLDLTTDLESIDFTYNLTEVNDYNVMERVEMQQLDYLRNLADLDIKNAYSGYIPKVSLSAGWGRNTGNDTFSRLWNDQRQWFTSSSVGLNVSIPVFDGLRKKYSVARKKLQLETLNNQYTLTANSLQQQLFNAQQTLDVSLEKLEVQESNMDLAKEVSEITTEKFKEGVGSNLEVINAEKDYKEAEINYLSALYEAIIAKVDLDKALGKLK